MHSPQIKRFVQETLGCTCPEDVFNKIDYQKARDGGVGSRVNVGDRLLIYLVTVDGKSSIQEVINTMLERGIEERNNKGFNRFRLVLVTSRPDDLRSTAEKVFDGSGYADEKVHLHVVSEGDVQGF